MNSTARPDLTPTPESEDDRRPLPAGAVRARQLPEYLPARMVNEWVYCPRLFFYEWVEGLFAHSSDTVEGALRHEKLETRSDPLPPAEEMAGDDRVRARSVELGSDTHKLIARIDLVEAGDGTVTPVEYKRGSPYDTEDGPQAWPADRAQVCVQALILRDNGYRCEEAVLYYNTTKQRVRVPIDAALVQETLAAIDQAWALARGGRIPPPLSDSPKCPRCSLVSICLPDETAFISARPNVEVQLSLFGDESLTETPGTFVTTAEEPPVRRLVPARDDLRPLYVTGHGLTIGKTGEVLQVRDRKGVVSEARIGEICQVNVFGNVMLTAAALQGLCWADRPIAHFSYGGWFYGLTQGMGLKNVFLRRAQFERAEDPRFALGVASQLVANKIRNQRTLLQRNHIEPPRLALLRMKRLAEDALAAADLAELLGIEGSAARIYFAHFAGMLKTRSEESGDEAPAVDALRFDFNGRNRRPPRDPVNALLSLGYSLLAKDLTILCHAIGFDPFIGYFHQPRFGRAALALDLMEGFRPLVADSAVLSAINTRMVTESDFQQVGAAVGLKPSGRKQFIRAYEQRMDTLVTHPLFGYRVSYRRVMEIQARLLGRVVTGELRDYPGFETR